MEEKPSLASNIVLGLVITGVLVALAWFVYQPYATAERLRDAVQARDAEALSRDIDYDALNANLKAEINAALEAEIARNEKSPERALSALFAAALVEPLVDLFVSPDGLARLMAGAAPSRSPETAGDEPPAEDPAPNVDVSLGYDGFNRFAITVANPEAPEAAIVFELHRYELNAWKLAAIRLPRDLLAESEASVEEEAPPADGGLAEPAAYDAGTTAYDAAETTDGTAGEPDGACIDMHVTLYRSQHGADADIPQALLDEWYADCSP